MIRQAMSAIWMRALPKSAPFCRVVVQTTIVVIAAMNDTTILVGSCGHRGCERPLSNREQTDAVCSRVSSPTRRCDAAGCRTGAAATEVISMALFIVDPANVVEFVDEAAFNDWPSRHHDGGNEVWVKLHKLSTGRQSIAPKQAIDVALCWGWIDAVCKGLDATSYLQRYTSRRSRRIWSQVNVANVARLIEAGRMTPHGLKHVEAGQADERAPTPLARRCRFPTTCRPPSTPCLRHGTCWPP